MVHDMSQGNQGIYKPASQVSQQITGNGILKLKVYQRQVCGSM